MPGSTRATALLILPLLILGQTAAHAAGDNRVIVSKRDGDYSNPIAAAKNALEGDRWCVSPSLPKQPCVIEIRAGIYVLPKTLIVPAGVALVGQDKREVLLVAGKGVRQAVASRGPSIAQLSIVNYEPDGIALVFGAALRSVALRARAVALTNVGDAFDVRAGFDISNSEISADRFAVRVSAVEIVLPFHARHSRIYGGDAAISIDLSGGVFLRDCEIAATSSVASGGVRGIDIDQTEGDVVISGGSLSAHWTGGTASGGTFALDLHDMSSVNLRVVGTHIEVGGAKFNDAVRLDREGPGIDTFDGVTIIASQDGLFNRGIQFIESLAETHIRRSHIDAPIAIDVNIECCAQPVEILQSFLNGSVQLQQAPTRITATVVTGPLSGNDVTCKNVYDANYVLHRTDCPTN